MKGCAFKHREDFPRDPQLLMAKPLDEVVSAFRSSLATLGFATQTCVPVFVAFMYPSCYCYYHYYYYYCYYYYYYKPEIFGQGSWRCRHRMLG